MDAVLPAPDAPLAVPWRLIRRLARPAARDPLVARLRAAGFDAGTNFPPLAQSFPALLGEQAHPDADEWGAAVLNLWLGETYDAARVAAAARLIRDTLDEEPRQG